MQTINERSQELAIRGKNAMAELYQAVTARMRDERGQIGAEFMGLLGIAALVIGALVALGVHNMIADAAEKFVEAITKGDEPAGFGGDD
jgi:hypothetical protein